jgi:hypothetical protein
MIPRFLFMSFMNYTGEHIDIILVKSEDETTWHKKYDWRKNQKRNSFYLNNLNSKLKHKDKF